MARIILNQDQSYIGVAGQIKFGKKGSTVDAQDSFLELITGKYDLVDKVEEVVDEVPQKQVSRMNKTELVELIKSKEIEISDEDLDKATKAELVAIIEGN